MLKITKYLKYFLSICLIVFIFVRVVDFHCFNKNFYYSEYSKLNNAEIIGVSNEDLNLMTDDLLDYLKGYKPDLSLIVNVKGQNREAFNERETIHMIDVKALYDIVIFISNICLVLGLIILGILIYLKDLKNLDKHYLKVLMFCGFIFGFIGLMCLIDFDSFWISFHELIFTKNDYWLLDPRTSLLINMVPSQFFFDLVIRIVVTILIVIVVLYFIFKELNKRFIND